MNFKPSASIMDGYYYDDGYYWDDYNQYVSTGFVFELSYPTGSIESISARDAQMDILGDNDAFGSSVATSDMYTVIGAPNTEPFGGVVHIYSADRQWQRIIYPPPQCANYQCEFGYSVALFSDWVLVGAPSAVNANEVRAGAAFLYSAITGELLYELVPDDLALMNYEDRFGHTVTFCGENRMAVVSATRQRVGVVSNAGRAWVFKLEASRALEIDTVAAGSPQYDGDFGASLSCVDQNILVGAPSPFSCGFSSAYGSASLYQINLELEIVELVHTFSATDNGIYSSYCSQFGASVALDGQNVVIGMPGSFYENIAGYVWIYNASQPSTSPRMVAPESSKPFARFGKSVAVSGDLLVVGAELDNGNFPDTGAAYTFSIASGKQQAKLVHNTQYGVSQDRFGTSVAIGGGHIVVGRNLSKDSFSDDFDDYYYGVNFNVLSSDVDYYAAGTAHYFLNMYDTDCDETIPPMPGVPSILSVDTDEAEIAWAASLPACYPVTSYVVYVRADGGSYEQAATFQGQTWATIELEPATQYRAKVAAVNSLGHMTFSAPSDPFTTLNTSYIRFAPNGAELEVLVGGEFAIEATSGSDCVLTNYFDEPEHDFGVGSTCRITSRDTMTVRLTSGAAILPWNTLNFTSSVSAAVTTFDVEPPASPTPITGTLDWSVNVAYCDDIELDALSFSGVGASVYGFEYTWTLKSMLVEGEEPANITSFEELFSNLSTADAVIKFPNGTFPPTADLLIAVSVFSPTFSQDATHSRTLRISDIPLPKLTFTPASRTVSIADQVTVQVEIDYGRCFLQAMPAGYAPIFDWSITNGHSAIDASAIKLQVSSDTRAATIPGFVLNDTSAASPYTIEASLALPSQATVSSVAMIEVFAYDPVAYIAGGDHAVFVSEGNAIIDASFSYDPNFCTAFGSCTTYLRFGYDCSYSDGSTCCGLTPSISSSTTLNLAQALSCNPEGSEVESVVVTVQVQATSTATGRSASSSIRLEIVVDGGGSGSAALVVEPVLPHSFSGFAGLSPSWASSSTTWTVIRQQTSTIMATMDGETAIFDMSGWPSGEQYVLQAASGDASRTTKMIFFTPASPSVGKFKVQSGQRYLEQSESVVGLVADVALHALDFVDSKGSASNGLFYQFTDTVEVFSPVNQSTFPITLVLNGPSSSNRLSALMLSPGEHTVQLSVRNRQNGVVQIFMALTVTPPYSSIDELLTLILSYGEAELGSKVNGVGAFAAALTWAAESVVDNYNATNVCNEYYPSLMLAQEALLRVWQRGADRAAQQTHAAIKALQDLYLLTLPGLCVEDSDLAMSSLQQTLKVFEAIPADSMPKEGCGMMTQILSSVLSLPTVAVVDMNSLQLVLRYMDEVLESYCGVSVFSYDSTNTQSAAFLAAASLLRDLSMSSVRTPPGEPMSLDLDGLYVEVDESAAQDLFKQLSGLSADGNGGFWDVSSYRMSRSSLSLADADDESLSTVLSDVFELNIRQATLPRFRYCNKVPGVVAGADQCVTKRVGSSNVSGLRHPIVFTVLADPVSIPGFQHSCQYVDVETNKFSGRGCKVLATVPQSNSSSLAASGDDDSNPSLTPSLVAVTCACDHMTAFAVRQMALQGESDCDKLSSTWKDTYHTPQYKAFVTLMLLAWVALLVMLVLWLRSVAKTIKHTNASLVANLLFAPACLLRIIYFAMLLHGWEVASNVACVEFGIAGSGSGYGAYTMLVLHDVAEPILLIAFTSVVLYWYELEKSLSGPLSKMLSSRYLSSQTLWLFIAVDMVLLALLVGVNIGLLAPDNRDVENTEDAARALLVVQSAVCICEAIAFIGFGWAVVKAGGGVDKMRKVVKLLCSSSIMFIVMATLQIVFASPSTVSDPRVTYGLYSILLHIAEFIGAAMMIQALAVNRKDNRTMIGSLWQKLTDSTSTVKWWPSSGASSSSGQQASSASKDTKKDMELVVSHYDFSKDQYVSRTAKGGQAVAATALTSTAPSSAVTDSSNRIADSFAVGESVMDLRDSESRMSAV